MRALIDHVARNRIMRLRYSSRKNPELIRVLIDIEEMLIDLKVIRG